MMSKNMRKKSQTRCRKPLFKFNGKVIRCGQSWEGKLYKTGLEFKYKSTRHFSNPNYKSPKIHCEGCKSIHNVFNAIQFPKGTQVR